MSAVASWPGLATLLIKSIEKELGALGRKRGLDASVSKIFRRFVQTADDERRSGTSAASCPIVVENYMQ